MVVGTFCVAVPMVLNGAIGAKLHVPFSVFVTSPFGFYLRYFCIVSRAILAMFWLGIQGANGAQCLTIMLTALAPSYANIPNSLPESAGITTQGMCSYFLFWIIQLPLLLIHPTKLKPIFWIKLVGAPIAAVATMGWCLHKAGGGGDIFQLRAEVSGNQYAWLWLSCMSSVTGSWATLAVNIPDFTRYARSANGQFVQLPFLPIIFTVCGVLGIVTTSATKVFTGQYLWNPLDIVSLWLENGSGGRAAAFFAALAWYIAQVGTNITANSISAANDLTVLFPRWLNIKRGCIIAAIIAGWILVPWKILSSADTFLAFMGGYAVFLGPMAGIMASDYWLIKKQQYDVPGEFHGSISLYPVAKLAQMWQARVSPPTQGSCVLSVRMTSLLTWMVPSSLRSERPLPLHWRVQLACRRGLPPARRAAAARPGLQHYRSSRGPDLPGGAEPVHLRLALWLRYLHCSLHCPEQDLPRQELARGGDHLASGCRGRYSQ